MAAAYLPGVTLADWLKRPALTLTLVTLAAIVTVLVLAAFDVIEPPHFYSHEWNER